MMMQCLAAGGIAPLHDNYQRADAFNPRGYFEYGPAMNARIEGDASWIGDAEGLAVKIMAYGLRFLPPGYDYRVIMMRRPFAACGESMSRKVGGVEPGSFFAQHYAQRFAASLARVPNLQRIDVDFDAVLASPLVQMDRVAEFLGASLDRAAMAAAVAADGDL